MLKRRLIPKLLVRPNDAGRPVLVTTVGFDQRFEIGDPVSQARIFQAQIADELVFLDFEGWSRERSLLGDILRKAAQEIFMPITAGGGVRSVVDVRNLLMNGADKVSLNSAAVEDPALVSAAARAFGSQCVVVSIDYRGEDGPATVWTRGGTHDTGLGVVEWAREAERLGAGELLLTSIPRDGGGGGLDVATIRSVVDAVRIPVVAGGGCGTAAHFIEGMQHGGAAGVAAGTFFSFRDQNLMQTRSHIANSGLPIRMHL